MGQNCNDEIIIVDISYNLYGIWEVQRTNKKKQMISNFLKENLQS